MARVTLGTGETITVGGTTEIFGTSGAQNVTILDGSTVTFRSGFNSGGDTIRLNGKASDFQVSFSGSNVTFQSVTDGITVVIPIGVVGNTIVFDNGDTRTLSLVGGVPTLGSQAITGTPTSLPAGPGVYEVTSAGEVLEGGVIQFTVTRTDTTVAETLNATVLVTPMVVRLQQQLLARTSPSPVVRSRSQSDRRRPRSPSLRRLTQRSKALKASLSAL
jgi:hypothetical protein